MPIRTGQYVVLVGPRRVTADKARRMIDPEVPLVIATTHMPTRTLHDLVLNCRTAVILRVERVTELAPEVRAAVDTVYLFPGADVSGVHGWLIGNHGVALDAFQEAMAGLPAGYGLRIDCKTPVPYGMFKV